VLQTRLSLASAHFNVCDYSASENPEVQSSS
jgi:hypothetical protein